MCAVAKMTAALPLFPGGVVVGVPPAANECAADVFARMCNSFQIGQKIAARIMEFEELTSFADACESFCAEAGIGVVLIR
jgi:hypothetical protein